MTISAFLIIPAAYKSAANAVGLAMGWGPNNYDGVALSNDGGATVTHWACRTDVDQVFLDLLANPPAIDGVDAVLDALDVNLSETLWGIDHATAVMADKGMVRVDHA
jgi:hypothetical protein